MLDIKQYKAQVTEAAEKIRAELPAGTGVPSIGIILGTGLGKLAEEIEVEKALPYGELPNFPTSTVESHDGRLLIGA